MNEPAQIRHAHFIGIGGAGMSGIAKVLYERGCEVTGSDLKSSHFVRTLERQGIQVALGHRAETIDLFHPEIVVCSSAIPESNPEVIRARELSIPIWPRAKMLSWLSQRSSTIAVAGTHGKTTTSSMIATMFDGMGLDPSFLIGGIVEGYDTNGKNGAGEHFVCEADESDGSFLYLRPKVAVVTNIEADHLDHYGTLEDIEEAFVSFMSLVGRDGYVVINGDNPHYIELARQSGAQVVTYGKSDACDFVYSQLTRGAGLEMSAVVHAHDRDYQLCLKSNPGEHNIANATAALAVAWVSGLDVADAAAALSDFKGARRRFTHRATVNDIVIVDDYGHHPTEIKATLSAASQLGFKRIICIFQPHRYSRTQALMDDFAMSFDQVDILRLMDVFSAGEMPIPGVSGKTVAAQVRIHNPSLDVAFLPQRNRLIAEIARLACPGDLILTLGAGDVTTLAPDLAAAIQEAADTGVSSEPL